MSTKLMSAGKTGTIFLLVFLFATSAGLRLVGSANVAFAGVDGSEQPEEERFSVALDDTVARSEIQALLDAIRDREAAVDKRQEELQEREEKLAQLEKDLSAKLEELVAAEDKLRDTLALAQSASENDIGNLVSVYENMKPKQAAALFQVMDPEFAAGFVGRMNPQQAAAIMANLTPEISYTISAILAGRNANAAP